MNSNKTLIRISTALLTAALCLSPVSTLTSCKKVDVGIIGGADGPTEVVVSSTDAADGDNADGENSGVIDMTAEGNDDGGEKSVSSGGENTDLSFTQNGLYTFANGETIDVPKDVSMYVGTVTDGTMNTVSSLIWQRRCRTAVLPNWLSTGAHAAKCIEVMPIGRSSVR